MKLATVLLCVGFAVGAHAQSTDKALTIGQIQDHLLTNAEKEIVSLAEAMPADKYDFAPTQGEFKGVRTFGQQMSHIAAVLDGMAAALLDEKAPDGGATENGPASLKNKEAIVAYLKKSFEHAHRAALTVTAENFTQMKKLSWGQVSVGAIAAELVWHSFDHYGQAVVYARMNNIVPPASRR